MLFLSALEPRIEVKCVMFVSSKLYSLALTFPCKVYRHIFYLTYLYMYWFTYFTLYNRAHMFTQMNHFSIIRVNFPRLISLFILKSKLQKKKFPFLNHNFYLLFGSATETKTQNQQYRVIKKWIFFQSIHFLKGTYESSYIIFFKVKQIILIKNLCNDSIFIFCFRCF